MLETSSSPPAVLALELSDEGFEIISNRMQSHYGIYLPPEKKPLVHSRLARRVRALNLRTFQDYIKLIEDEKSDAERQEMLAALTTNVTAFFRERHHFELLGQAFNRMLSDGNGPIKIWSAGCSHGAEPLSIALTWVEHGGPPDGLRILATDVDPRVLGKAEAGFFSDQETDGIPPQMRARHFKPGPKGGWLAGPHLQRMITYRPLNLVNPFPFSGKFNAIFCRNVAIYFDETVQTALWRSLYAALLPEGRLFIGHSERLDQQTASQMNSIGVTAYQAKPKGA